MPWPTCWRWRAATATPCGFLTATVEDWRGSYFAVHNWWHLALVHLEAGRTADALAVYDDAVRAEASTFTLDLVDASSLLWRL